MTLRGFKRCLLLLIVAALATAGAIGVWLVRPLTLRSPAVEISIEPGTSPRDVAQAWVDAGVDTSPRLLYEWFRWSGKARSIRAGTYEVSQGTTPQQLLTKLIEGDEAMDVVRFIDGWTFRQMRAELARSSSLKLTLTDKSDAQVMEAIGAPAVLPEGRFFPDTYVFSRGVSDVAVLKRAYAAMQKELAAAWQQRDPNTPLNSAEDALILASIVEKETGVAADRGKVAGVFVNRLRIDMPLQTDPTIIYGLGASFDGNLRKRHLQTDGPFNTYLRRGLPPTAISMPGRASLLAAVKPEATKALYFVARGDGSSQFSATLAEHNQAVNKYQRGR